MGGPPKITCTCGNHWPVICPKSVVKYGESFHSCLRSFKNTFQRVIVMCLKQEPACSILNVTVVCTDLWAFVCDHFILHFLYFIILLKFDCSLNQYSTMVQIIANQCCNLNCAVQVGLKLIRYNYSNYKVT